MNPTNGASVGAGMENARSSITAAAIAAVAVRIGQISRHNWEKLPIISVKASLAIMAMTAQYTGVEKMITPAARSAVSHHPPSTAAAGTTISSTRQYQNRKLWRRRANSTGGSSTSTARIAA